MGFYGNITNTSRTTFQFDRIYSSRQAMDDNCSNDGIYAGRYVLVEYDSQLSSSDYDKSWYLVTNVDGKHIPYGSVSSCKINQNNFYLYFNGPDATTSQLATDLQEIELKIIYFDRYKHFTISNSRPVYIKAKRDGSYNTITWDQFRNHYNYQASENGIINSNVNDLEADGIVHAHIANGVAHIEDTSLFENNNTEIYAVVLPGAAYTYNVDPEWWTIQDTTFNLGGKTYAYLNQVPNDSSSNYLANFNIDQGRYHTARGYDSTVWQKVYSNGVEKYVMIAELNTIVPTFGVSSDPPSLLPISPHFGADSTNVYYELHWQPNWGFRIKAANNELMIPKVNPNGQLDLTDQNNLQSQYASINARNRDMDDVYYPSDQLVKWQQTFEDNTLGHDEKRRTLYFDPDSQKWGTDNGSQIPSAIYFNRSGFNSTKIAYSKDLISEESRTSSPSWNRFNPTVASSGWANEDNITLSPTGLSGNVYNLHDGSVDLKPQADTQELSIMLPTIGDTIAHVWDLVYGGRNTTRAIASTNTRNKDIAWEDAKGEPARRGLRLTGIDGDEYNTAQVDTIAGAINTAHDLLGMIISSNTTEELSNPNELDNNRIYYDSEKHQYFRKHKTYEYTEVPEDFFIYQSQNTSNLNQELIDSGLYYVWDETLQEYVIATVYDPTKQYFLKQSKEQYTLIEGKLVDFPYGDYKWYRDYLSENSAIMNDIPTDQQEAKSDYILNPEYQDGRDYYRVDATEVTLNSSYEPERYWYKTRSNDRQQLVLDLSDQRQKDTTYYTVDTSRLYSLKTDRHFAGVYVPGVYYFKRKNGTFELDLSDYQTCNGEMNKTRPDVELETDAAHNGQFKYYLLNIIKSYDTTGQEVLYRRSYSYKAVTNLTENTFINDTYYIKNGSEYTIAHEYDSSVDTYYLRQVTYVKIEDNSSVELEVLEEFYNEELVVYQVGTYFLRDTNSSGELRSFTEITRADFLNDQSIYNKEVWVFGERENPTIPPFMTLDEAIAANDVISRQDSFYQENTYHYLKNGSYILDTALSITPGRQYYLINPIKLEEEVTYYQAGVYYVESEIEDEYELAIDIEKPDGNIYQKEDYYVIADSRNILPKGTKWNPDAAAVPNEITLGTRRDKWEIINIPDYSKTMGTLNGMILQMYQIIEPYDKLTRSNDNVSGVINQVKDIIARFESLKSREVVVVDDYGRAHSASIATLQHSSYNQEKVTARDMVDSITLDKYPEASTVGSMQHRWITAVVDGNPEHPQLTIHHNFQPVTNTQSWLNKNGDTLTEDSISLLDTDNISLYTPIVDGMGHVVGHDTKTVTLPYSFKTFTISNEDTDDAGAATTLGSNGSIIADNTQDTFIFKTANKWLRFVTDTENDTLTIAHKLHTMTETQSAARETNKNADEVVSNSDNDKIILHDIVWDDAAHMLEDHPHTYTLPYGFKFIATDAASMAVTDLTHTAVTIAAESTQDTVTFKSANIWTKLSADATDDSVTFGHLVRAIDVEDNDSSNLNIAIGGTITDSNNQINIQDITHDEAGHIRSRKSHVYTLPYDFKFVTSSGTTGDPLSTGETTTTAEVPTSNVVTAALNTQDILTIDPGNAWLKVAINQNDRKVSLYHYVAAIDKVASTATDFNNISNGQFTLKDITHDDAGHITAYKNHQYTLPYSFKTFTHSNTLSGVTDLTFDEDYSPADHKIIATTVVDSFNFMSQNKWIRLQADGKTLKLSHLVNNFEPSTSSNSLSSETTGTTTFTTISISKDEAGHLTALDTKTLTMPNSFGKIALSTASTNNTNELTSNTTGLEADCTHDTLTFAAGDRWIHLAGDADNDKITIGHASPDSTYIFDKGQTADASLNYGGTFKVVHPKADKYGHIGSLEEYTITIPSITLTEATNTSTANVITGITLNTSTGAIGYTQKNVSELQLTNFNYNSSSQSNADLITGDTINGALAKLQKKIYDETTATTGARDVAINTAIQSLDSSLTNSEMGKTLTGITITDGKITNSTFGNISITSSQVSDLSTTISGAITTALNGLTSSATGTLGAGNTITALTQSNGKVSYTASAISITSDQVSNFATTSNSLIESKINNLNANNSITSGQYHLLTNLSESNGIISYTSEALSWNHISALLPTSGDDVLLTVGNANSTYLTQQDASTIYLTQQDASTTYLTQQDASTTYANISIEANAYTDDTVFDYSESYYDENENEDINYLDGTETELTVQQLVAKVKELERRIGELENPNP